MEKLGRIVLINLGVLAAYTLLLGFGTGGQEGGLAYAIFMMFAVGLHVLVNLILMIVFFARGDNSKGKAFLFSMLIVLIVGFATCVGVPAMIYG